MDAIGTQITDAPKKFLSAPIMVIVIGLMFSAIVMLIEAKKPGIITDKVRKFLSTVGLAN